MGRRCGRCYHPGPGVRGRGGAAVGVRAAVRRDPGRGARGRDVGRAGHHRGRHHPGRAGVRRRRVRPGGEPGPVLRADADLRGRDARHRDRDDAGAAADGLGDDGRHQLRADRLLVAGAAPGHRGQCRVPDHPDGGPRPVRGRGRGPGGRGQRPGPGRPAPSVIAVAGCRHRRGGAGRVRQVGAAAALILAVAGDGRPEPGLGAAALGHHGRRRCVPAAAHPGAAGRVRVGESRRSPGRARPPRWCSGWSRSPRPT